MHLLKTKSIFHFLKTINDGMPGPNNMHKRHRNYRRLLAFAISFCLLSFMTLQQHKTTVYLVGDSTMADKDSRTYPETGWGMPFAFYFDSTIKIDNRAKNGRSTRTFIEQGRWKSILETLQKGDYVLIQFGHNDEVPTKGSYSTPDKFVQYLNQYVSETRAKGAFPVLITPVARRSFDTSATGEISVVDTHKVYGQLVRDLAAKLNVPLIDLQQQSMDLLQQLGPDKSLFLYNHLAAGENPHYPKGHADNTHFNELGARKMAEIVLKGLQTLQLPLAKHIQVRK